VAIVAESLAPGAVTSEITLRYGLHRNQLYGWRREFRAAAAAEVGVPGSDFVPIVAEHRVGSDAPTIEIEICGAIRAGRAGCRPSVSQRGDPAVEGRSMILPPAGTRVLIATARSISDAAPTGWQRPCRLRQDPFGGTVFVFRSKRAQ
jgi:hypothetical protein